MKAILVDCLLVGAGGFFGAICRYVIAGISKQLWDTAFPVGTLVANVVGCFLIGSGHDESNRNLFLLFGVGFLGALTTFSTFGAQTVSHVNDQSHGLAISNVVLNVCFGLAAVFAGMWLGKRLQA
jgi:CrcB protein